MLKNRSVDREQFYTQHCAPAQRETAPFLLICVCECRCGDHSDTALWAGQLFVLLRLYSAP